MRGPFFEIRGELGSLPIAEKSNQVGIIAHSNPERKYAMSLRSSQNVGDISDD